MFRFSRDHAHRQTGFTLIETMVGFLIIAAAASTVYYGVNYARAEIVKIEIRERALEELSGYMDYWIARINYGTWSVPEGNGDNRGEEVTLYNPTGVEEEAIVGKIYRDPMLRIYNETYSPDMNPCYRLKARIEWVDHLADNETSEIELEVYPFAFR